MENVEDDPGIQDMMLWDKDQDAPEDTEEYTYTLLDDFGLGFVLHFET